MSHVPIRDYYGPTFWILEFGLFNNLCIQKAQKR